MRVVVDIGSFWPKTSDGEDLSINAVYKILIAQQRPVDYRSLKKAKAGDLEVCRVAVLANLRDYCSDLTGRDLQIEDLLKVKP